MTDPEKKNPPVAGGQETSEETCTSIVSHIHNPRTETRGSRRFVDGEVWDDLVTIVICQDCGQVLAEY